MFTANTVFESADGTTRYTVDGMNVNGNRVFVAVSCQEFDWAVTNPRATFSTKHVQHMLDTGKWTVTA